MKKTILLLSTLTLLFGLFSCSSDDSGNETTTPIENPVDEQPNPSDPIVGTWKVEKYKYYYQDELVLERVGFCSSNKDEWIFKDDNLITQIFYDPNCESEVEEYSGAWINENGNYVFPVYEDFYELLHLNLNSKTITLKYNGSGYTYEGYFSGEEIPFDSYIVELKKQ